MRNLSPTLTTAQTAKSLKPLIKITLSHAGDPDIILATDRILDINHSEEPYSQRAEVLLHNSDLYFTDKDLKGWKAICSYGLATSAGEEYSLTAPLWVIAQRLESSPGKLACVLLLQGIPNLLADDEASEIYIPTEADTKTVKTLINEILGATLACYSHCAVYEVVYDSEDSLISIYQPKDGFRIYTGGSRLAAIRRLLDYTKCVLRFGADGKIHILVPQISGTPVYSYALKTGHTFFSKASRKRLVIPNYVVVKSNLADDPQYLGYAQDTESYNLMPKREYHQGRLASNAQATEIATAILSKYQLWSELGSANVPMNVGSEVFDYVKVTDERQEDSRTGTIGYLARYYNAAKAEWRMVFSFGNYDIYQTRETLKELETRGIGDRKVDYSRLRVKDLYAENINAKNIDMIWLDPDNTIDLTKIGDNLDNLPDGLVYARVKLLHLDAGLIKLDENILYKAGYDPTTKERVIAKQTTAPTSPATGDLWLDTSVTPNVLKRWDGTAWIKADPANIDDLPDGTVYRRTKSAALSADGLVLLDATITGTYGLVNATAISAGNIKLSTTVKDGVWYNETGVEIDAATGIKLKASSTAMNIKFTDLAGTYTTYVYVGTYGDLVLLPPTGCMVYIYQEGLYVNHLRLPVDSAYFGGYGSSGQRIFFNTATTWKGATGADIALSPSKTGDIATGIGWGYVGDATYWWYKMYSQYYFYKSAPAAFQDHDDIAMLRQMKPKRVRDKDGKERELLDMDTIPAEVKIREKRTDTKKGEPDQYEEFIDASAMTGLLIGAVKQLAERLERLEVKVR